jgi:hypothetical protein
VWFPLLIFNRLQRPRLQSASLRLCACAQFLYLRFLCSLSQLVYSTTTTVVPHTTIQLVSPTGVISIGGSQSPGPGSYLSTTMYEGAPQPGTITNALNVVLLAPRSDDTQCSADICAQVSRRFLSSSGCQLLINVITVFSLPSGVNTAERYLGAAGDYPLQGCVIPLNSSLAALSMFH